MKEDHAMNPSLKINQVLDEVVVVTLNGGVEYQPLGRCGWAF
jgi:hypothetical protein